MGAVNETLRFISISPTKFEKDGKPPLMLNWFPGLPTAIITSAGAVPGDTEKIVSKILYANAPDGEIQDWASQNPGYNWYPAFGVPEAEFAGIPGVHPAGILMLVVEVDELLVVDKLVVDYKD